MKNPYFIKNRGEKIVLSDEAWQKVLPGELYDIARKKGTERPFSGEYVDHKEVGVYYCRACGNGLFRSTAKFDSQCGWPSFFETLGKKSVIYKPDNSHGMHRTEIVCGACEAHLGHVFEDGPEPTRLRYCLNSVSLLFEK